MESRCSYCGEPADGHLVCSDCLKEISGYEEESFDEWEEEGEEL